VCMFFHLINEVNDNSQVSTRVVCVGVGKYCTHCSTVCIAIRSPHSSARIESAVYITHPVIRCNSAFVVAPTQQPVIPDLPGLTGLALCLQKDNDRLVTCTGRAIAEAVSRWLPTAAARVQAQVTSCGICGGQSGTGASFYGGQSGTGAGFLRVLGFPLPILISPTAPHSSSIIRYHSGLVQ
jgi:hypothetical protein